MLGAEEGEEETEAVNKAAEPSTAKPIGTGTKASDRDTDVHSKVSTACTNGEPALIKIKQ